MSMELDNFFTVPVPPDQAWDVLLDVERIAPCMPGAAVEEVDGDVVTGRIRVKVGPVSLTYRGTAKFTERDPDARVVVVEASGKEIRGAGTASATVRASLAPEPSGNGTEVTMHTTMNVTGRPAQFGRGVMVEVGGKLVDQFAQNLADLIAGDTEADAGAAVSGADVDGPGAGGTGQEDHGAPAGVSEEAPQDAGTGTAVRVTTTTAPPPAPSHQESLNLVRLVGPAMAKRVVPVVLAAVAMALLSRRLWHLRHREGKA